MEARTRIAHLDRAMIKHLGPMLTTGSSQNANQDITITTAAGMADLEDMKLDIFSGNFYLKRGKEGTLQLIIFW